MSNQGIGSSTRARRAKEQLLVIQDFHGGLASFPAPNRINPNQAVATRDVWFEGLALAKRNQNIAATPVMTDTSSATNLLYWGGYLYNFIISGTEYLICAATWRIPAFAAESTYRNLIRYNGSAWAIQKISTAGTIATTSGSPTVTGTGTAFLTTAQVGAEIVDTANSQHYLISSITNDTTLTLTSNSSTNGSGLAYYITAAFPLANSRPSLVSMNNIVYAISWQQVASSWDGTNQAWVTAAPQAHFAIEFKNYVFAAHTIANRSRVSWSAIKTPTSWPASNFIDVSPDDGQEITGLFNNGAGSIVVLKTHSAYHLTGDTFDPANPTYTLTKIMTPSDFYINTASSVQAWKGGFMMLGRFGMYFYNGTQIAKLNQFDVARNMFTSNAWRYPSTSAGGGDYTYYEPRSLIVDGRYWCLVNTNLYQSTVAANGPASKNMIIVIDQNDAIWTFVTSVSNQITTMRGIADISYYGTQGTVAPILYGVQSTGNTNTSDSFIQMNTTSGSETISGSWTSKVFEFPNKQRFGTVYVIFKKQTAGNLTFEYSIDEGSFTSTTIDMTTGSGTRVKSAPLIIGTVGRSIQFRLSNSTAAQPFEIYAIELHRLELRT